MEIVIGLLVGVATVFLVLFSRAAYRVSKHVPVQVPQTPPLPRHLFGIAPAMIHAEAIVVFDLQTGLVTEHQPEVNIQ